ncbi:MAG TPA: hypothetical protein VF096_15235 [Azonexus sp.]
MRVNDQTPLALTETNADAPAAQPAANPLQAKAEKAAEKFEAFFIAEMMRQMRRTAREFGDQESRDKTADDMLDLAHGLVADTLAGQHAFGVADLILRQVMPSVQAANLATNTAEQKEFKSDAPPVALNK